MLSSTASLYKPAAFGGAEILDPWECMAEYRARLLEAGADMVLPLCHLYEFQVLTSIVSTYCCPPFDQDERTCRDFDFPVVLSGHDHHKVDRVVEVRPVVYLY